MAGLSGDPSPVRDWSSSTGPGTAAFNYEYDQVLCSAAPGSLDMYSDSIENYGGLHHLLEALHQSVQIAYGMGSCSAADRQVHSRPMSINGRSTQQANLLQRSSVLVPRCMLTQQQQGRWMFTITN